LYKKKEKRKKKKEKRKKKNNFIFFSSVEFSNSNCRVHSYHFFKIWIQDSSTAENRKEKKRIE
jgi:hypothetical protein